MYAGVEKNPANRASNDPGFFGPQSLVWQANRERINYLGGLRAILMQLAHPSIASAVADHSGFRQDPLGRFRRTMEVVQDVVFGDRQTALQAARRVRRRHSTVRGALHDCYGRISYHGNDPALLMWVFATLIDSLRFVQNLVLPPQPTETWRQFYKQGLPFARLFGVPAVFLPETLEDFNAYVAREMHSLTVSPTGRTLAAQLFGLPHGFFRPVNTWLAAGTLPDQLRLAYGLAWRPVDQAIFEAICQGLRGTIRLAPAGLRYVPAARKRERTLALHTPMTPDGRDSCIKATLLPKKTKNFPKGANMNWLQYFQRNHKERPKIQWDLGIHPEPGLLNPLIGSLQKFQVGESGEGNHLKAGARRNGDRDYFKAIELFIAEEQEHARMLERIITTLGGSTLKRHWSDMAFIALRRLMGLKMELGVLLIAEMIAKRYYRALHEGTADPVLRAVFGQIRRDEEGHITFHLETLNRTFGRWPWPARALVYSGWRWMFRIVSALVAADHRQVLEAVGVSRLAFWKDCQSIFESAAWYAFQPLQDPVDALVFPSP